MGEKIKDYQLVLSCSILAATVLFSTMIFASKIQKNENVTVTGSASKIVKSDNAKLEFKLQTRGKNQKEVYTKIKSQENKVKNYLTSKEIEKENIEFKPIQTYIVNKFQNGMATNEIEYYTANQYIEIKSKDVLKIKEIATDIGSLTDESIEVDSNQPEYYYSDLSSIKVDLLKEAALDAKQRAKSMLSATGSNVGKVQSMKMGVFQITPPDSTMVADFGLNDTTTIDKKVTAVANIVFKVK